MIGEARYVGAIRYCPLLGGNGHRDRPGRFGRLCLLHGDWQRCAAGCSVHSRFCRPNLADRSRDLIRARWPLTVRYGFRKRSGNLAIFTAILRASSLLSSLAGSGSWAPLQKAPIVKTREGRQSLRAVNYLEAEERINT